MALRSGEAFAKTFTSVAGNEEETLKCAADVLINIAEGLSWTKHMQDQTSGLYTEQVQVAMACTSSYRGFWGSWRKTYLQAGLAK